MIHCLYRIRHFYWHQYDITGIEHDHFILRLNNKNGRYYDITHIGFNAEAVFNKILGLEGEK